MSRLRVSSRPCQDCALSAGHVKTARYKLTMSRLRVSSRPCQDCALSAGHVKTARYQQAMSRLRVISRPCQDCALSAGHVKTARYQQAMSRLRVFNMSPCVKSVYPIRLKPFGDIIVDHGLWLNLRPRQQCPKGEPVSHQL
ncbi:hypothetical protein BgiMline_002051 [Biomphalaria glabrata]